jgi:GH24 family phage-related lysozyme (muramidase)
MINDDLKLGLRGFGLLAEIEQLSLIPYDDQTGKPISEWCRGATIGYGHLIARKEWDVYRFGISEPEAVELFSTDLWEFEHYVRLSIIKPLTQNQFDALVILAYNIGVKSFVGSSVVKLINDPAEVCRYASLESAWKAWNKSQGKECQGLINRRCCEWEIWKSGIYKKW